MIVGISQRVEFIDTYQERRDCLDQRWFDFLESCGITAIPLPNNISQIQKISSEIDFDGFILSGGGDLVPYGGTAPERDTVEIWLIKLAISNKLPLLGVCRGMQAIQNYFKIRLQRVEGHVASTHLIRFKGEERSVNSFHNWSSMNSSEELIVTARSLDNMIEAIEHREYLIQGVMWHPEREKQFTEFDKQLFINFFSKKND